MSTLMPTAPDDARTSKDGAGAGGAAAADALDPQLIAELQAGGISLSETFGIALSSLTANKLRTLLTALGVIIGVAAVVALMAIGSGSQQSITASITANGANLLTVRPGASNTGGIGGQVGSAQTLTSADAKVLADPQNVPDASLVSPEYYGNGQLVTGSQNLGARVCGATSTYLAIHNLSMAEGDFITGYQVFATVRKAEDAASLRQATSEYLRPILWMSRMKLKLFGLPQKFGIWADADQGKTAKAAVKSGLQMQLERQREPFIRQK